MFYISNPKKRKKKNLNNSEKLKLEITKHILLTRKYNRTSTAYSRVIFVMYECIFTAFNEKFRGSFNLKFTYIKSTQVYEF